MRYLILSLGLMGLCASPVMAQSPAITPAQKAEIEKIVKAYLIANPEVIAEAVEGLQKREEAKAAETAKAEIRAAKADLTQAPDDIVVGNSKGDVTLVEFFDYNCPYCRKAVEPLNQLLKDDLKVRLIHKIFPVLGPASTQAARAVIAAKVQGAELQLALHKVFLDAKGALDEARIMAMAKDAGLNTDKLKADMADPRVLAVIEKNRALGQRLGVNGTPTYVLGDKVLPGVDTAENFKKAVDAARKAS